MRPIRVAKKADKKTAPAAISFIIPIFLWCSGCIKSAIASIAVLIPSTDITKAIAKHCKIHSVGDILKKNPAMVTKTAIPN